MGNTELIEFPIRLILSVKSHVNILYEVEGNKAKQIVLYDDEKSSSSVPSIQQNIEFSDSKNCVVFKKILTNNFFSPNCTKDEFVKAYIKR